MGKAIAALIQVQRRNKIVRFIRSFVYSSPNIGQSERATYHSRSPYSFAFGHSSPVRSHTNIAQVFAARVLFSFVRVVARSFACVLGVRSFAYTQ